MVQTTERLEVTEYLDGNGEHALTLMYPLVELRGAWEDRTRRFAESSRVYVRRVVKTKSLRLVSHSIWPVGTRNVKVTYWADVPVELEAKTKEAGKCQSCGDPLASDCPRCKSLWES